MRFESITLRPEGGDRPDEAHPGASWRSAGAELRRHGHLAASWSLRRAAFPGIRPRIFVFPAPEVEQPPASLWMSNLREQALEQAWCDSGDVWAEVVRAGWAGYDFTKIHERAFSASGGALDGIAHPSWEALCDSSGMPATLLCAMDWAGLHSMWGGGLEQARRQREGLAIRAALGPPGARGPKGRPLKA